MRISLFAGAGAGKSTLTSGLFYHLKCKGYKIELVHEFIKQWAYEGKTPKSFDPVYIFAKQLRSEDSLLQSGVKHLITDSPIMMQMFYSKKYGFSCWKELLQIGKEFESKYPSTNIFLDRGDIPYQESGRYETEEVARNNDLEMKKYIEEFVGDYKVYKSTDLEGLLSFLCPILD